MKKLHLLLIFLLLLLTISCANDNEDPAVSDIQNFKSIAPYISTEMAKTIAFLDTCTTVVPIEQLFPLINSDFEDLHSIEEFPILTRSSALESYTGRTSQYILYQDAQVTLTETQVLNWSSVLGGDSYYFQAGKTYYLTAIAVMWQAIENNRTLAKSYYFGTNMGVDPDNTMAIGYNFQQLATNVYLFTSYVFALRDQPSSGYLYKFVPFGYGLITDTFNLKWYYIATTN